MKSVQKLMGADLVRRSLVSVAYSLVRYAPMVMLTLALLASSAFAQTTGESGSSEPAEFEEFPEFFNFTSLVTNGIAFIGGSVIIVYGAIVAWRLSIRMFNTFVRRVG